jgi:hypothetical protein
MHGMPGAGRQPASGDRDAIRPGSAQCSEYRPTLKIGSSVFRWIAVQSSSANLQRGFEASLVTSLAVLSAADKCQTMPTMPSVGKRPLSASFIHGEVTIIFISKKGCPAPDRRGKAPVSNPVPLTIRPEPQAVVSVLPVPWAVTLRQAPPVGARTVWMQVTRAMEPSCDLHSAAPLLGKIG